jgi:arginine decarboxylase
MAAIKARDSQGFADYVALQPQTTGPATSVQITVVTLQLSSATMNTYFMKIHLISAVGKGTTELGAFDNALMTMGFCNYNLIRLSSVIPPGATIVKPGKYTTPPEEYGDRLYCVYAEIRSSKPGQALGSSVGWYQIEDGRGVFVEHETLGDSEKEVKEWLEYQSRNTVKDLLKARNLPIDEDRIHIHMETAVVEKEPLCTFIVCAYKSERW